MYQLRSLVQLIQQARVLAVGGLIRPNIDKLKSSDLSLTAYAPQEPREENAQLGLISIDAISIWNILTWRITTQSSDKRGISNSLRLIWWDSFVHIKDNTYGWTTTNIFQEPSSQYTYFSNRSPIRSPHCNLGVLGNQFVTRNLSPEYISWYDCLPGSPLLCSYIFVLKKPHKVAIYQRVLRTIATIKGFPCVSPENCQGFQLYLFKPSSLFPTDDEPWWVNQTGIPHTTDMGTRHTPARQ